MTSPPEKTDSLVRSSRTGPITAEQWQVCLDTLAAKGPDAARLSISGGRTCADGRPARSRTLSDLIQREPFKSQWAEALTRFVSKTAELLQESSITPEIIERWDPKTGNLVERRISRRDANWAAVQVLRRYDPEWRETKRLAVDGQIQHQHQMGDGGSQVYRLSASDVLALPAHEQETLFRLLEMVEVNRAAERRNERAGAPYELIEHKRPRELAAPEASDGPPDGAGAIGP